MGGRVYDDNGSVNDNNVIIKDGATVTSLIYGGYATGSEASKNTVIVDSAVANSNILGGHSGRAAKVNENTVIVRGDSKVEGNITGGGGHAGHFSKEAHNNKVSIEDNATIIGVIKGGESKVDGYTANGNQISIGKDANISQVSEIIGGTSAQGTANKNNIIIGGSVTGGEGKIGSENNNIKVAGNIGGTVIGGKTDSGSAGNNIINIDGNTQGNIIGGQTNDPNGQTGGNQITANGNVDGNIYGGYNEATQKVQGSNNTITLSGDLTKVTGNIQVGDTTSNGGSGNTLNINTKNPVTLEGNTSGAKTISIAVSNIGANQAAITIGQNGSIDVNNTTITAQLNLQPSVQSGDPIQLFKAEGNASTAIQGSVSNIEVTAVKGGAITYKVEIDPNNLGETGKVGEATGIKEETKTISEGLVAGAAAISVASENAVSKGVDAATSSTSVNMASAGSGTAVVAPFGSSRGGTSKIKTGSYVKSTGISVILGAANGKYTDNGKLTIEPFMEMGKNWYSTYNDFGNGEVRGDGDSKYIGAGLLARYDFGSTMASRPYIEGSARLGRNYNRYENTHMNDGNGNHAKYDMSTNYFGIHVGAGYEFKIYNQALDIYAKYLYNNLAGDEIEIMNTPYEFKAVESHKLITGARYKVDLAPINNFKLSPYADAALDYEFKGSGDVYASGFAVDSPTLSGASAMLEAGLSINTNRGFTVDVGAFGHLGKRQGINGLANIKFEF